MMAAQIIFQVFVTLLAAAVIATVIGLPIYALRRLLRAAGERREQRELDRLVAAGGPIVATGLDPKSMADLIGELDARGYAVMPTGPDSIYAMPPKPVTA